MKYYAKFVRFIHEMHLKMSSTKWRVFCLGLIVLKYVVERIHDINREKVVAFDMWYFVHPSLLAINVSTAWMMTPSNGSIFCVTGYLCGDITGYTKAGDAELLWCVLFLRLNKRLSKQSSGWWFEMLSHPLWRHYNEIHVKVLIHMCDTVAKPIGSQD